MGVTIQQLCFAAEYLQLDDEAQRHADRVAPRNGAADRDRANGEAYEAFLARRLELFTTLPARFDTLAIGWHRAAVRVFGERAAEALDALVACHSKRATYYDGLEAERRLRAAMALRGEPVSHRET